MIPIDPRCTAKKWLSPLLLAALAVVALLSGDVGAQGEPSTTAAPAVALGGGASFPPNSVVEMLPGQVTGASNSLYVMNAGSEPAEVEFVSFADPGIVGVPEASRFTLQPDERTDVPFSIEVSESVPPGEYSLSVMLRQADQPSGEGSAPPGGGEVTFLPGISARLIVRVVGDGSELTVRGVNAFDGSPVVGRIVVTWKGSSGDVVVAEETGSEITRTLAPGDYHLMFEIEGFSQNERDVTLAAGESTTETFELEVVSFDTAVAKPAYEGSEIVSADIRAAVTNQLAEIAGPVTLEVEVVRDGEKLDDLVIQELNLLPTGKTEFSDSYRPDGGWEPGTYRFVFSLVTPAYTIQAPDEPEIVVDEPAGIVPVVVGIAALVILVVVVVAVWLSRRRRRRQSLGRNARALREFGR